MIQQNLALQQGQRLNLPSLNTGYITRKVNPNQLVSNQLTSLLSAGSPYIQQARQQSQAQAASRGLLNSSMAAGSGQAAAIRAGMPIAAADAAAYGQVESENMAAGNEYQKLQAQLAMQANAASASASAAARSTELQREMEKERLAFAREQWEADKQYRQDVFAREGARYDQEWERQGEWWGADNQYRQDVFAREGARYDQDWERLALAREQWEADNQYRQDVFAREGARYDQEWERQGEWYNTDWQRQLEGTWLGNQLGQQSGVNAMLWQTIFSDPSVWRNPSGAAGIAEFWGNFSQQFLRNQVPEFLRGFGIGTTNPAGGG